MDQTRVPTGLVWSHRRQAPRQRPWQSTGYLPPGEGVLPGRRRVVQLALPLPGPGRLEEWCVNVVRAQAIDCCSCRQAARSRRPLRRRAAPVTGCQLRSIVTSTNTQEMGTLGIDAWLWLLLCVVCCVLCVVCCVLCVVCCVLCVVCCVLLVVGCWLLVVGCWLFKTRSEARQCENPQSPVLIGMGSPQWQRTLRHRGLQKLALNSGTARRSAKNASEPPKTPSHRHMTARKNNVQIFKCELRRDIRVDLHEEKVEIFTQPP